MDIKGSWKIFSVRRAIIVHIDLLGLEHVLSSFDRPEEILMSPVQMTYYTVKADESQKT
jgi:hypothetical protein